MIFIICKIAVLLLIGVEIYLSMDEIGIEQEQKKDLLIKILVFGALCIF